MTTTPVAVTVLHNQDPLAMALGAQPGDTYTEVWSGIFPHDELDAVLESVWETLNVDHPVDYNVRSLSLGDVVELLFPAAGVFEGGTLQRTVGPTGWDTVNVSAVNISR